MEIRLPYFYDKKFRDKNVEAIIKCLDGQTLTYVDTLILLSGITDSCSGTMMEFNLTRLTLVKMNEQKFVQPRPVTKDELDWLINRANAFWRLVPKEN
jgi:hypothetical protein